MGHIFFLDKNREIKPHNQKRKTQ